MNTRQKGRLIVKKAQNILETLGFLVQTANPKLKFIGPGKVRSMNEDFFGRWDLMAVHASRGYMKFIQVSVWEKQSEKIHQVEGFPNGDYSQEIWLYCPQRKNSHFKVLKYPEWKWNGGCEIILNK